MKHPGFCQLAGQVLHGFAVGTFYTTECTTFKEKQFFKSHLDAQWADLATGHADGVSLFKNRLLLIIKLFKYFPDSFSFAWSMPKTSLQFPWYTPFLSILLDRRLFRLSELIVNPCNPIHSFVLIYTFKGTTVHTMNQLVQHIAGSIKFFNGFCWHYIP